MEREAGGDRQWRYVIQVIGTDHPRLGRMPAVVALAARQDAPFSVGAVVAGRARLTPPSGPAAPGAHDFSFAAYFSGTGATGFFYGAPRLVFGPPRPGLVHESAHILETLARWRSGIGDRIRARIGGDEGALAAALITNEQRAISRKTVEDLRRSGLAHIIAISGMNMVLASAVFFIGLRSALSLSLGLAQSVSIKKLAASGAVVGTGAYYLLSGFALSAERAFVMMVIALVAVLLDRPAISLRTVALAALITLVFSPSAGLSASFQLSYAGTLGLIAAYEAWAHYRPMVERPALRHPLAKAWRVGTRSLAGLAATALVGGLSTALFSVEHFQRFPLHGFVANMLAAPLLDLLVMPMALLAMLLMPLGLDALPLKIMGFGLTGLITIGEKVAASGGEYMVRPLPDVAFVLGSLGFLLLCLLRTRLRLAGLLLCALGLLSCLARPADRPPDLLIHESGEVAALLHGTAWSIGAQTKDRFVTEQWQRLYGMDQLEPSERVEPGPDGRRDQADDRYRPLSDAEEIAERALMAETLDQASESRFFCKRNAWCLAYKGGTTIILVSNSIYSGIACDMADILVARTSRYFQACRSGALLIPRDALRLTGSLALHFGKDPRKPDMESSYEALDRPWLQNRLYDWRTGAYDATLPPALRALIPHSTPPLPSDGQGAAVLLSDSDE